VFHAVVAGGHSLPIGSSLALKIYSPGQIEERTDREIDALRRIKSETLVTLVGSGRCQLRGDSCLWLETAFIEGEPLSTRIGRGPLNVSEVSTIIRDIAIAVEALWAERIVHRDIKPDNIMLTPTGRAVLIDLGVARHVDLSPLTTLGKTWGTEGYLSPEQATARRALTCKSDVFALGIVAQESLLGRHPTSRRQSPLTNGGLSTNGLQAGLPLDFVTLVDAMVHHQAVARPLPHEVSARATPFIIGPPAAGGANP
jgi:eukaryotic-like serine/threonine-protein kinase